jgi:hypothetical protein
MCPVNLVADDSRLRIPGESTGQAGGRSSFLEPPAGSFLRARDQKSDRPVEAAGAVDAKNAPTAPWKTAQTAVFHSYHRRFLLHW